MARLMLFSSGRAGGHFSSFHRVFSHRRWSSHSHLMHRWGHKWVVLALRVRVPGTARTWALPVLVALYRMPEESEKLGLRHKTPPELMQGLLALWLHWFPPRKTVFAGDGGFATHRLSRFAAVRRSGWQNHLFPQASSQTSIDKLTQQQKTQILNALALSS